jgi:hypothetical protein
MEGRYGYRENRHPKNERAKQLSSQEEKKPIIDQMADLAAKAAGTLAATAVHAVAPISLAILSPIELTLKAKSRGARGKSLTITLAN